jgi:hypothetical protein
MAGFLFLLVLRNMNKERKCICRYPRNTLCIAQFSTQKNTEHRTQQQDEGSLKSLGEKNKNRDKAGRGSFDPRFVDP